MRINVRVLKIPLILLLFLSSQFLLAQPAGFQALISSAQGNRIQLVFNTIDEIENGITLDYKTILGLTLQDADGFNTGDEYDELYLRVSTDDDAIYTLDGSKSLPLNVLEVTCTNVLGFDGAAPATTETFAGTINLSGSSVQDQLLFTDRPDGELINYSTHRVQVEFRIGVTNSLSVEEPGYYVINIDFWLYGCGTWGGVCP